MPDPEPVVVAAAPSEPPAPDYKALLEAETASRIAAEAEREKQARDYAALKGTVRSQTLRDAEWSQRLDNLSQQVATIAKVGDEDVQREAAEVRARGEAARAQAQFEAEWAPLHDELKNTLIDAGGKPLLDLATAPELADVRELYRGLTK